MSGVLPALWERAAPLVQCGPKIGGSFLLGFLFTPWEVTDRAHRNNTANVSQRMNSVSSGGCEAARIVEGFSFVSLCVVNNEIGCVPRRSRLNTRATSRKNNRTISLP